MYIILVCLSCNITYSAVTLTFYRNTVARPVFGIPAVIFTDDCNQLPTEPKLNTSQGVYLPNLPILRDRMVQGSLGVVHERGNIFQNRKVLLSTFFFFVFGLLVI